MIEIEKLYSDENADLLKVLEFIKDSHKIGIGAIQRGCEMGYGRVARYIDLMIDAGLVQNPHKYHMVIGIDGKKHRRYLPNELVATDEELQYCITELKQKVGNNK